MHLKKLHLNQAHQLLEAARPIVSPNRGFLKQLELFQRLGCQLSTRNEEKLLWRLESMAKATQCMYKNLLIINDIKYYPIIVPVDHSIAKLARIIEMESSIQY